MSGQRLIILYGTETGNSQDVAKRIGREAKSYGLTPVVQSLHKYQFLNLEKDPLVLFVVATTGQGDVPEAAKAFWKFIFRKSLGQDLLKHMQFAVFGLGDSAYVKFNVVAKKLHNRLSSLGAQAIVHRGLGDDQADDGYEAALDPWLGSFWERLRSTVNLQSPTKLSGFEDCPFSVEVLKQKACHAPVSEMDWFRDSVDAVRRFHQLEEPDETKVAGETPSADYPFFAQLKKNDRITSDDHFQDTRHLVLDTALSSFEYNPGDVLAVHPLTPWESIDAFLERLGMDPFSFVSVECTASNQRAEFSVRSLVQGVLDVASASPRRFFFEVLSDCAKNHKEKERLGYLSSASGREELSLYNKQSGRTVVEVLSDFGSCCPSLGWLLEACPRKLPRRFSIASSPKAHPNEVHLTVAIVAYRTKARRLKHGLCTSYLSHLEPGNSDALVSCWVEKGSLNFENARNEPLLLIGPGTGVAPFRSVLHERRALRQKDPNDRPPLSFLFFGSRNELGDFYYAQEWDFLKTEGTLDKDHGLITAFSRDQKEKIYVTHRISEHGALIADLLMNKGGCVFVAGSANKMPNDVRSALQKVLEGKGGLSSDEAQGFLRQMDLKRRYQVESWS